MRNWSAETIERLRGASVAPVLLADLHFRSGDLALAASFVSYNWKQKEFMSAGFALRGVEFETMSDGITPLGAEFVVSARNRKLMDAYVGEGFKGREADLHIGFCDVRTGALIKDEDLPFPLMTGEMREMPLKSAPTGNGGVEITISLSITSPLARWDVPPDLLYSAAAQRGLYPPAAINPATGAAYGVDRAFDETDSTAVVYY